MQANVDALDSIKDEAVNAVQGFKAAKPIYLDLRLEFSEGKGAIALQGNIKDAAEDYSIDFGIRAIARYNGLQAAGYIGGTLGIQQLSSIKKILSENAKTAVKRAIANSKKKSALKKKHPVFGKNIGAVKMAETKINNDFWKVRAEKNPRDISLQELINRTESVSGHIQKIPGIASNYISAGTGWERKLFVSSEGTIVDQQKPNTQVFVYVTAAGKAVESHYESLGNYYGPEVFDGKNQHEKTFEEFAEYYARGTVELSNAPAAKPTGETTVVSDPSYNTLVCHEIIGHPSEADRALKREAAWAGRAWWFRNREDNEFGNPVASELVNVFSDPEMPEGYGYFKYDDEGVKAKKIYNIKDGCLNEFINSRETAAILGTEPNGGMRASNAFDIPIIRMTNTCFAPGNFEAEEIIRETRSGWYAVGQKIPSIGETRQNFRISCWKLYKIENGEPAQLYRGGSITADSHAFLKSIDAVCKDFRLYNIPNCGKGTPMQTMRVGNGGPTMRGKARIAGAEQ